VSTWIGTKKLNRALRARGIDDRPASVEWNEQDGTPLWMNRLVTGHIFWSFWVGGYF